MDVLIFISEGFRMFKRALKIKKEGFFKYKGNADDICKQIIEACWESNDGYFRTSKGSYPQFYSRDFGLVVDSLIKLGYQKRVRCTLDYALNCFRKYDRVTTTITPKGKPFDFPRYAPDSLAFLLYSLNSLGDKELVKKYKHFLNKKIFEFVIKVVDMETGLVKKKHFSSMKDYSIRKSSCYDLCMCYMVQKNSELLGLENPLNVFNYKQILMKYFWNENYFLDDLSGNDYIAGDANVMPFWCGLINDKKIKNKVIEILRLHKLDVPFPLKYTHEDNNEVDMHWLDFFASNWEGHMVWIHLGYIYIGILDNKKLKKEYLNKYKRIIEKYKNHLEVFEPNGKPFKSKFYISSDSMLWAANYLGLQ